MAEAAPSLPPLQLTLPSLLVATVSSVGSVMVTVLVAVHPLASVVVTVYVPALNPLIAAVVAVVDHR